MPHKVASQLEDSDRLELPGWMLHGDLAGLHFEIQPVAIRRGAAKVFVDHLDANGKPATTWLRPDEEVTLLS